MVKPKTFDGITIQVVWLTVLSSAKPSKLNDYSEDINGITIEVEDIQRQNHPS
jgi:hypothetical protein